MFRVSVPWSLAVLALTTLVALTPVQAQDRYTVTDLGRFLPADINDAGSLAGLLGFPTPQAAVVLQVGEEPLLLGSEVGGLLSNATALNELATLVGTTGLTQAFRWTLASGMELLDDDLASVLTSSASDLNAGGTVVGCADTGTGTRPVAWVYGQRLDLGTLGGPNGCANAINDAGTIVGYASTASGAVHATRWTVDGEVMDLTPLACAISVALDLTPQGTVVGGCLAPGSLLGRMFLWTPQEGVQDLGVLSGHVASEARSVNADGIIVGTSRTNDAFPTLRAVRWQAGVLDDLTTLLETPGWVLLSGAAINNQGWIVGVGIFEGTTHGYLLTPVPDPAPALAPPVAAEEPGASGEHRHSPQHSHQHQARVIHPGGAPH